MSDNLYPRKKQGLKIKPIPAPLRITIIYLLVGFIWIILSDYILLGLAVDKINLTAYQTLKGVGYVSITAMMLYLLIRKDYIALKRSKQDLKQSYDATLKGWVNALDLRDHETEGHTNRVAKMTLTLARALGAPEEELEHIRRGALLHDIGKMGIPDRILHKPDRLTEEEWEIIRQHPVYAYNLLSQIEYLQPATDIPYCHHEKWDGSGYPRGLKGEEIPLVARIFSVVDVWDALRSDRPYRKAWSEEETVAHLKSERGKYFQPEIVDRFLLLLEEFEDS